MSAPDTKYYAINGTGGTVPAGTVTVASGSAGVAGSGTSFLSGYTPGDTIVVNGEEHTILSIGNNTALTTVNKWGQSIGGAAHTLYTLQPTLFDLAGIPWPKGIYDPYSQPLDLGDGSLRAGGWPTAEWQWKFLGRVDRQSLRTYIPILSNALGRANIQVRFRTRVNENNDAFVTFKGQMIWPRPETLDTQRRVPFVLKFRALIDLS